jgi:hypothetical protein
MNAVVAAAPPVATGLPVTATIAVAVTVLAAVLMLAIMMRRSLRTTKLIVGVSVTSALAIVVGALLVGGSLTQPPTAAASEERTARATGTASIELKLTGVQLPTL